MISGFVANDKLGFAIAKKLWFVTQCLFVFSIFYVCLVPYVQMHIDVCVVVFIYNFLHF